MDSRLPHRLAAGCLEGGARRAIPRRAQFQGSGPSLHRPEERRPNTSAQPGRWRGGPAAGRLGPRGRLQAPLPPQSLPPSSLRHRRPVGTSLCRRLRGFVPAGGRQRLHLCRRVQSGRCLGALWTDCLARAPEPGLDRVRPLCCRVLWRARISLSSRRRPEEGRGPRLAVFCSDREGSSPARERI